MRKLKCGDIMLYIEIMLGYGLSHQKCRKVDNKFLHVLS